MSKRKAEDAEFSPAKKRKQKLNDNYTVIFKFVKASRKGENFAFCKLCNSDFAIGHGGAHDIRRLEKTSACCFIINTA